jgi:hypothetical protein
MVSHRRVLHDQGMGRHEDRKLELIARSVVGRQCSRGDLRELGRVGDLIDCSAGTTFHSEREARRWAYLLLDGDVALTHGDEPIAVATEGSWFPLQDGGTPAVSRTSLTALNDARLLVFRPREVGCVLDLPALAFAR